MTSSSGPLLLGPDVAGWQTIALVGQPSQPPQPNEPGGRGADFGKSSPVGLVVLVLFFIAVAFLVRSMTKHLKRVPASFDVEEPAGDPGGDAATDPAESGKAESKKDEPTEDRTS